MKTTLGVLAFLALALPALAADLSGPPTVIDGETLQVAGTRVRLAGIDAPEPAQLCRRAGREHDCGLIAASQLADITAGATVVCRPSGQSTAGQSTAGQSAADTVLAICKAGGYDLSYGMVYSGWALADPAAASPYRMVEGEARSARRGIWRYDFVPPWEWRDGRRLTGSQ